MQVLFLFLFGMVIAGALLWSLIPRRNKFEPPGMLLDRKAHPRLFTELESIANALNEPLPREVYLIGAPNAFVADRGGVMGFGSRRIMGLGLPLLSLLTVSQFRAVLAHEFAHYYGGDTSLGPWVYKTKTSMVRIFESIGSVGELARIAVLGIMYIVVATLLKWYFIAFLRVINVISRKQEYRADELACLIAGRQNLIDGLQSIHRAAVAWPHYWKNEITPSLGDGSLPALGDGFLRFLTVPQISAAISNGLATRLQEEKTQPYDTHPPLRDRIAAAQKLPDCPAAQDTQAASTLLDNLAATELSFVEQCVTEMRPGTLKYVGWDDVATEVTIPAWERFVAEYAEHLRGVTAESVPDYVSKVSSDWFVHPRSERHVALAATAHCSRRNLVRLRAKPSHAPLRMETGNSASQLSYASRQSGLQSLRHHQQAYGRKDDPAGLARFLQYVQDFRALAVG